MEPITIKMTPDKMTPERVQGYQSNFTPFRSLAERYRQDESLRARVDAGDVADLLPELGINPPPGVEVRIVADGAGTHHVVLPPDPNQQLSDEALAAVAGGGKTASTAGTVGTASSMACSTVPSSASSAGSAGSVGTAA